MDVAIKILDPSLSPPCYATPSSAGMDLCSSLETFVLKRFSRILIPTGIAVALPKGFEAQIRSRSGLSLNHGIIVLNAPGTIDADYRGEIGVVLANFGDEDFKIERGMRIAQMIVAQYTSVQWNIVDNLDTTQRQDLGFGSTGL